MEDDSRRLSRWVQFETGVRVESLCGLAITFCFCFITHTSFQELERISLENLKSRFCSETGAHAETIVQFMHYTWPCRALLYMPNPPALLWSMLMRTSTCDSGCLV